MDHTLPFSPNPNIPPFASGSSSTPPGQSSTGTGGMYQPVPPHHFFPESNYPFPAFFDQPSAPVHPSLYNHPGQNQPHPHPQPQSHAHAHFNHDGPIERGRTGHPMSLQKSIARNHPYSRSPSRNPASRDSSRHRDPSTGGNGTGTGTEGEGGTTPPKSGRAGVKRRQKYSRTRTGCLCCRARRIKCDEERPVCRRCVIAKKECQYPDGEGQSVSRQSSREDPGRGTSKGRGSRNNTDEPDDANVKRETNLTEASSSNQQPYHDPFNLTLPAYGKQEGIVDQGDYNWDQSFVGNYGGIGLNASLANLSNADPSNNAEGVQQGNDTVAGLQQKYGTAGSAPMLATPNFLLPWFPTQEERSLILHYCANAADLMMAIPSGLNPMLAINLPLALDSPRGVNNAADALRVALLGIGAIHQAFLLARSGVSTTQTTAMFQYASNLRDMGKELVRRSAAEPEGAKSDAALGAATALGTIDIFFGGEGWIDNFNTAKEMVAYRGGPAAMLKASKPKQLAEGVTISPARLMLEILAIYDVFGCLATGEEPALLSDKYENWWFEGSQSTYEEHSVEKQFGMSRVMVHLFSRLTRLVSRVDKADAKISEIDVPDTTRASRPPTPTSAWLSSLMKTTDGPCNDPLSIEARKLNSDVDAWIESLQLSTLEHERVQVGNRAYAYAMKILLLRRVFKYPREDVRVQNAANEVLRHCSTSTAILGMSIDLMWPAIIAGCCVEGEARQWLLTLLEGFKSQCCFDVETATRIIQESWRRVDAKEPRDDWREICEDFGLKVLLC